MGMRRVRVLQYVSADVTSDRGLIVRRVLALINGISAGPNGEAAIKFAKYLRFIELSTMTEKVS